MAAPAPQSAQTTGLTSAAAPALATVTPDGLLHLGQTTLRCALGKGGVVADKRESDGGTPLGPMRLLRVLYRADKVARPETALPVAQIGPADGWCDDPAHRDYNRPVQRPFPASHEALWRFDDLYDLLVITDQNADPVVPDRGSAIFVHVARPDYGPTLGCVALAEADLRRLLALARPGDAIDVLGA